MTIEIGLVAFLALGGLIFAAFFLGKIIGHRQGWRAGLRDANEYMNGYVDE